MLKVDYTINKGNEVQDAPEHLIQMMQDNFIKEVLLSEAQTYKTLSEINTSCPTQQPHS